MEKGKRGGARKGSGRKPFNPTEKEKKQVEALSGYGLPLPQIGILMRDGVSSDTIQRHFAHELAVGKARANSEIGKTLFQRAMNGDTSAMIFWAKTQMGWRDVQRLEHSSPDGTMTPRPAIDVGKLSESALAEILTAKSGTN